MAIASPAVLLLSALAAAVVFGVFKAIQHRLAFRGVPMPPHSWFWGHLKLYGETARLLPPDVHPQLVFTHMYQTYNLPEVFYVDLWPLGPTFLVAATPDAAAHVVQVRGYGKSILIKDMITPMVGQDSIVAVNGPTWKATHHMLAPAFKTSAVRGLLTQVAEEMLIFRDRLDSLAREQKVCRLEDEIGKLIFDIICRAVLGVSFGAQTSETGSPIMRDIQTPIESWYMGERTWNPLTKMMLKWKATAALKRSGAWLRDDVTKRYRKMKKEGAKTAECLVEAILVDRIEQEEQGVKSLEQDSAWMDLLLSHAFGGYGTTTDTLTFAFMLLSVHPESLKKLREEHDRVCGPGVQDAIAMVQDQPHRTAELEYTTGVIKETLRLYPVGFSPRGDDKDNGVMKYKGRNYPTTGTLVCPLSHTMHYDASIYEEPASFKPERWLGKAGAALPRNAWRPFELGPRSCMGRELAVDEMRVVLLMTVRWFDFILTDDGSGVAVPRETPRVSWTKMDTLVGDIAFQEVGMEAKPRAGMPMRLKRTERPL